MTQAAALQNVFSALGSIRARQGAPQQIELLAGEQTLAMIGLGNWSKSAVNSNSQVVFLILEGLVDEDVKAAQIIQHGTDLYVIQEGRKSPAETNGYWLLPVKLGGTND